MDTKKYKSRTLCPLEDWEDKRRMQITKGDHNNYSSNKKGIKIYSNALLKIEEITKKG